jgi:hypothetical protein
MALVSLVGMVVVAGAGIGAAGFEVVWAIAEADRRAAAAMPIADERVMDWFLPRIVESSMACRVALWSRIPEGFDGRKTCRSPVGSRQMAG